MRILGLDIGTSFLKGAVLDLDELTVGEALRRPLPAAMEGLPPRHVALEPSQLVTACADLLAALFDRAPDAVGLMVCSQMHGLVVTDDEGRALSPVITWQDQRALEPLPNGTGNYYEAVTAALNESQLAALGNGMRAGRPLCTLYWMAQQGELPREGMAVSLGDYVLATLAKQPPQVEATTAASMGMLDLATRTWRADVMAALGLEEVRLPPVVSPTTPVYEVLVGGKRLPAPPPVGDHQCALAGALLRPGELSLNVSTGSQISLVTPNFVAGKYETRPYFDGQYLQTVSQIPAGRALTALVKLLSELAAAEGVELRDPWGTIAAQVEATPDTDVEVGLSFFDTLLGDEGHLLHLREENLTVGHLFRGAFRAMARNFYACADLLSPPQQPVRLVYSGGLVQRFGALRQEIEAQFKLPARPSPTDEDTMMGLLALGLVTQGRAATVDEAVRQIAAVHQPIGSYS